MGIAAFNQALKNANVSRNPRYNAAVKRVGMRIAHVANARVHNWDFKVIQDDKQMNAFALPGGKVAVYTGIMPIAQTDAGLATVMAHEIAHVVARHGGERMSAGMLAQLGETAVSTMMSGKNPKTYKAVMQAYGLGANIGVIMPFGRSQESEADRIGLIYMAKAGYDPREALAFWQRMSDASKGKRRSSEFLSTHPSYGTRTKNLRRWMPQAMVYYNRANKAPNNRVIEGGS